uniref:Uncharacterized protein n=1 Tax=Spironucleus salmonicida TaxID=348837 RepID=V6LSK5_9EUKA|eukprot:EST43759.1 Hypothetical protein SS50377_16495 [Spironucleus salmonicida]
MKPAPQKCQNEAFAPCQLLEFDGFCSFEAKICAKNVIPKGGKMTFLTFLRSLKRQKTSRSIRLQRSKSCCSPLKNAPLK